jgi:transcriptional regulator with XRE-family HTH domain
MNRFKALRYERGLTIIEVARGAQVSRPTLYDLEREGAELPSAPIAKKLADFYGLTVAELLGTPSTAGGPS